MLVKKKEIKKERKTFYEDRAGHQPQTSSKPSSKAAKPNAQTQSSFTQSDINRNYELNRLIGRQAASTHWILYTDEMPFGCPSGIIQAKFYRYRSDCDLSPQINSQRSTFYSALHPKLYCIVLISLLFIPSSV